MFTSNQIFAVVGSPYISEHHSDELRRHLPASEAEGINLDSLLNKLRSALSCWRREG